MKLTQAEFERLFHAVNDSLTALSAEPDRRGFDREIHESLRDTRDLLVRARRHQLHEHIKRVTSS